MFWNFFFLVNFCDSLSKAAITQILSCMNTFADMTGSVALLLFSGWKRIPWISSLRNLFRVLFNFLDAILLSTFFIFPPPMKIVSNETKPLLMSWVNVSISMGKSVKWMIHWLIKNHKFVTIVRGWPNLTYKLRTLRAPSDISKTHLANMYSHVFSRVSNVHSVFCQVLSSASSRILSL